MLLKKKNIGLFIVRVKLFVSNLNLFYKMLTYLTNTIDFLCVKIEVQSDF